MRLRSLTPILLPLFAMPLVACNGSSSKGKSDTVAVVNGDKISRDDFYTLLEHKPQVRVDPTSLQANGDARVAGTLGFQALADLIKNQVILQIAKEEGVAPSESDLTRELTYRTTRQPDFLKQSMDQGFTKEQILRDLRVLLSQERVVSKGVTVPDSEVNNYIAKNPRAFEQPKAALLSYITVSTDAKKKQVDEQLNGKVPFSVVAQQLSEAPGARTGKNQVPQTNFAQFPPQLQRLVDATPQGQTTAWMKDGTNWVKFSVDQKRNASAIEITPVIKETVKRQLAQIRGEKGSDFKRKLARKIISADVRITDKIYADLWKKQVEEAKAADTASGS